MTADTRVDIRIDTLVSHRRHRRSSSTVREALHEALRDGRGHPPGRRSAAHAGERPDVTVALRDPLPTNPIELGRLVAAHVVREVLP